MKCGNCGNETLFGQGEIPTAEGIQKEKECPDCDSKIIVTYKKTDVETKEGYYK